eukprot:1141198-Pelagomonas_calceolata.AAC.1
MHAARSATLANSASTPVNVLWQLAKLAASVSSNTAEQPSACVDLGGGNGGGGGGGGAAAAAAAGGEE